MQYLPSGLADDVAAAALQAGYGDPNMRSLLFRGIMPIYVGTLPMLAAPALQLYSDVNRMNTVERLLDGTVPLQVWLQNAVKLTAEADPRQVFQQALDATAVQASAEPLPPPPDELPEIAEKVVFHDDTVPYSFLRLGLAAGEAVARLTVAPYEGGQRLLAGGQPAPPHLGTGWLLTDQLLVTNHHVVAARSKDALGGLSDGDLKLQGANTVAAFGYDSDDVAIAAEPCAELVAWSTVLDYAVLRLRVASTRRPLTLVPDLLAAASPAVGTHTAVNIIQHPMGDAKRVALRNNLVTAITDTDIRYFTDTRAGSSGSPVFDDNWQVVALHRGARRVEGVTFQGRDTAYVNVGTRLNAIIADLRDRFRDVASEVAAL